MANQKGKQGAAHRPRKRLGARAQRRAAERKGHVQAQVRRDSDEDSKPYFKIDGRQISDSGGEVIFYQELRKTPLGDNIQANGGVFMSTVVDD